MIQAIVDCVLPGYPRLPTGKELEAVTMILELEPALGLELIGDDNRQKIARAMDMYSAPTITPSEDMISSSECGVQQLMLCNKSLHEGTAAVVIYEGIGVLIISRGSTGNTLWSLRYPGPGTKQRQRYLDSVVSSCQIDAVIRAEQKFPN